VTREPDSGGPEEHAGAPDAGAGEVAAAGSVDARPGPATDVARRQFFRQISRDAVHLTAQAVGIGTALQRNVGAAVGSALGLAGREESGNAFAMTATAGGGDQAADAAGAAGPPAGPSPYRIDGDVLVLVDQRRYPETDDDIRCSTPYELADAMLARAVNGPSLLGMLAAYGAWLAVVGNRSAPAGVIRTRIRTAGATFRAARANVQTIPWAVDRMLQAWDLFSSQTETQAGIAAAMRGAADDVAAQLGAALSTIRGIGRSALPSAAGTVLQVVARDPSGLLPDSGAAFGIVRAWAGSGVPVHVWLPHSRSNDFSAGLAARELVGAGIPTTPLSDAAIGWLLATTPVDLVLVEADRIAADGATTATVGTYPLAALARASGVPFWVVSPLAAFDPEVPGVRDSPVEVEPWRALDPTQHKMDVLAARPGARGPLQDVTPSDLIDAIVTEAGFLRAPLARSLALAVADTSRPA
jgi:methylthioribose-1-phosphate isomerase